MHNTSMVQIVGTSIEIGKVPFNIYKIDTNGVPMLFAKAGYEISPRRKELLNEAENRFYIQREELRDYVEYAADRIHDIIRSPNITHEEKVDLVKRVGSRTVHRILSDPEKEADRRSTQQFVDTYVDVIVNLPSVKTSLFDVAQRGKYLLSRSFNVCTLCLLLGRELLGEERMKLRNLGIGGLLIDVGMTRIKERIIEKQGPLETIEMDEVMLHPFHSDVILQPHQFHTDVLTIVRQHHERLDGSGYPHGLKGSEIHALSQIVAVADTYDAITSERPYKPPQSHMAALEEMVAEVKKYNIIVFKHLLRVVFKENRLVDYFISKFKLNDIKQREAYPFNKRIDPL